MARVATAFDGTDFTIGAVDETLDDKGFIQPGVGDIGDRLYGTNLN
jgi:uracil phosphoribosyltransferase